MHAIQQQSQLIKQGSQATVQRLLANVFHLQVIHMMKQTPSPQMLAKISA